MSTYQDRKAERIKNFEAKKGLKMITCPACNGSGKYDHCIHGRVPNCGNCDGTGKVRERREVFVNELSGEEKLSRAIRHANDNAWRHPNNKAVAATTAASCYGVKFHDVLKAMK